MAGATLVVGPFGSSTHREAGASRPLRQKGPSRNGTVTNGSRLGRMLRRSSVPGARMPNAAPTALGFRLPRANREKGRGGKFA